MLKVVVVVRSHHPQYKEEHPPFFLRNEDPSIKEMQRALISEQNTNTIKTFGGSA